MKKIMIIYGHGGNDPGAGANGINERDFFRLTLHPHLVKWANLSKRSIEFYTGNAYQTRHLEKIDPKAYDVLELHLDGSSSTAATGGHVIIHADYVPDDQDKRLMALIERLFGCRGGKCFNGRRDLQNPNIARHRGINYRLAELCFVTNANDVRKLLASLDEVAKGIIEAMTGETLETPKPTPKPTPIPTPKEENMIETAILIGSIADFPTAEPIAKKIQAPIYLQGSKIMAKHLIIVGGKQPSGFTGKITNLSGRNRFETAAKVRAYLGH